MNTQHDKKLIPPLSNRSEKQKGRVTGQCPCAASNCPKASWCPVQALSMHGCKSRAQVTSTRITITYHTSTGYSEILTRISMSALSSEPRGVIWNNGTVHDTKSSDTTWTAIQAVFGINTSST
ncbi:hypothetical protein J6590_086770 [Homalodisca vitripennis]|nr:hypothetical protein J6590_086770 [Homalodisca vitripennis]